MKTIDEIYNNYFNIYKNNLLGIFSFGNINYNFLSEGEEAQYVVVYIPTFSDLCFVKPKKEKKENITILDLRLVYYAPDDLSSYALELLFSKEMKINPFYNTIFTEEILNKREEFGRIAPYNRVQKSFLKSKTANDFEAMRLFIAAKEYIKGTSLSECFSFTEPWIIDYLWNIKENNKTIDRAKLEKDFSELENQAKALPNNKTSILMLKEAVIHLIGRGLESTIDSAKFLESLTKNEKQALKLIKEEINNDLSGYVSIKNLLGKTSISRPVFTNTLNKMKDNKIAKVENKGVKGTYIEFLVNINV